MMNKANCKIRVFCFIMAMFMTLLIFVYVVPLTSQADDNGETVTDDTVANSTETARPSVNGMLHVQGSVLADKNNRPVQLRGISSHGLTWYPEFINENLFSQYANDWNCNMIRLAMYASIYCSGEEEKEESYAMMKKGIDAAMASDMYILVDWHMLEKGNPLEEVNEAKEFFEKITADYPNCPNIIYEICNEPNKSATWSDIMDYSSVIIPTIRVKSPDNVIVVGTPDYDKLLSPAYLRPLPYRNVTYSMHFYAASHQENLRREIAASYVAGVPVFISECGICEADGDGDINFESAAEWFTYLNSKKISYAVWSSSDKDESSAFFKPGFDPEKTIEDKDLTESGLWVRELIRGNDPKEIDVKTGVRKKNFFERIISHLRNSLGDRGPDAVETWPLVAAGAGAVLVFGFAVFVIYKAASKKKRRTYDDVTGINKEKAKDRNFRTFSQILIVISAFATLIYLGWRIVYSVPIESGPLAIGANILLLLLEILGFAESMIMYRNMSGLREHPLPEIPEDAWPDVDIFIATYNEPVELLTKTINGCKHLKYPDASKVHIWVCDDNRRAKMRELAEKMEVGYFDRPDNSGAKAGNLNHALGLTEAPYIVTLDADMIVKSDFLLKTIPYFVDVEIREQSRPEGERLHLGFLQTPQAFYQPDVFQHALYSERRAPNEQDFFYRTIEPSKTASNSVIYGGSNTILSRKALNDAGGFYTESITEDIATGLLIQSAGYISLALGEPLASGQTPHTFREHIKQRTRWGRGVIVTLRKLKVFRQKNLSLDQKINYWSSGIYWYSPVKNMIYLLSPLLYAVCAVPVFKCNWLELLVFWLPMFILQDLCIRVSSKNSLSLKWSGIYETSVMPHLFIPVLKETFGITLSSFKVTDKSKQEQKRTRDIKSMIPFIVFSALSVAGIVRLLIIFDLNQVIGFVVLLFWILRNLYFLVMSMFLVDGRDTDGEEVHVLDAETVLVKSGDQTFNGVTTQMTEHNITVYLDENSNPGIGSSLRVTIKGEQTTVNIKGVITGIHESRKNLARTHTIEILDFEGEQNEYLQLLYDRVPTLPQKLHNDFGLISHLWQNIIHRLAHARKL